MPNKSRASDESRQVKYTRLHVTCHSAHGVIYVRSRLGPHLGLGSDGNSRVLVKGERRSLVRQSHTPGYVHFPLLDCAPNLIGNVLSTASWKEVEHGVVPKVVVFSQFIDFLDRLKIDLEATGT